MAIFGSGRISYISTPNFLSDFNETWSDCSFCQKNDPVRVWTRFESELRRNGRFSFGQHCPVVAGTWLEYRSVTFFFGLNFRILARKSVFCYRTPDFVNGPFVALAKAKILAPSDPFLNFSFPSYGRFREGDPPTQQKVLPHLTVGALTDSNSPCARSALALRARALRSRAGLLNG